MRFIVVCILIASSLSSPVHKNDSKSGSERAATLDAKLGKAVDDNTIMQPHSSLDVDLGKAVDDSTIIQSHSTLSGFQKMPDCLTSEPFCGGAMYLYYLRWRNLFVDEWPYVPADPTCFRDTLLLDYHADSDGATESATGVGQADASTFNVTFVLPFINTSRSDEDVVSLYQATVYVPLAEALKPNAWIEVAANIVPFDDADSLMTSGASVVAVADVWQSDEECRERCIHYVTANLTDTIASIWNNEELSIVVTVTLHCTIDEETRSSNHSIPSCLDYAAFSYSDVPALLFDYTICGDNSTQNYYISQLVQ